MTRIGIAAVGLCLISPVIVSLHSSELSAAPAATSQGNGHFSFALIGDMPYGSEGDTKFPNIITEINADRSLAFVVHDGDFKNGSSVCSDEVFQNRLTLFNRFNAPFIFVPGDNEWTDCHRANNGSFDPIERLQYLRALFFPNEQSLGRHTMTLERQSDDPQSAAYRENVRWVINDVVFAGLHVVGSNNNYGGIPGSTPPSSEYVNRNAATLVWLHSTFALAATGGYKAVMLIIQADPLFEVSPGNTSRAGFNDFLAALESETIAFGKPVVLVHGDSHYFRIDKPLIGTRSGRRVENFTRVETFGELDNHWLHVDVSPGNPNVFVFDQRIVTANLVAQR
jgi:Calcineurin-like phosphoesterase